MRERRTNRDLLGRGFRRLIKFSNGQRGGSRDSDHRRDRRARRQLRIPARSWRNGKGVESSSDRSRRLDGPRRRHLEFARLLNSVLDVERSETLCDGAKDRL